MNNARDKIASAVKRLYSAKHVGRDDWCDWLYENHVLWVAATSRTLAEKYGADADMAFAMGLLHDIADAVMSRVDERHEVRSLEIAQDILVQSGADQQDVDTILDALKYHGCHDGKKPHSLEGQLFATADAMAHFETDFYAFAHERFEAEGRGDRFIPWLATKIERDYHEKILFDDERAQCHDQYIGLMRQYLPAGGTK